MAKEMHAALKKVNNPCDLLECKKRNHITIVTSFMDEEDLINKTVRDFSRDKVKK